MSTAAIQWTLDRTYATASGAVIRVLQRDVPLDGSELQQELEPFCRLPTLLKTCIHHRKTLLKGMVAHATLASGSLSVGFRPEDAGEMPITVSVGNPVRLRLTVWRVDSKLDALQLNIECQDDWLYLHTGGDLLLPLFFEDRSRTSLELAELFFCNGRIASPQSAPVNPVSLN